MIMKKNKLFLLTALLIGATAITGCRAGEGGGGGDDDDEKITVNFYADFNQVEDGNIFAMQTIDNKSKLKDPGQPTSIYPEFPVFLGWSYKEIIDNKEDLWNFSTDKVDTEEGIFNMYGIWVSQGEQ